MDNTVDGCGQVERLALQEAGGGGLTRAQQQLVADHVAQCATCRAEAVVQGLLSTDGGAEPPLDELAEQRLLNGIMQRYEAAAVRPGRKRRRSAPRRLRWVAAALATAVVGAVLGIGVYRATQPGPEMSGIVLSGPTGPRAQIQLSAGQVLVDGGAAGLGAWVRPGQTVRVKDGRSAVKLPAQAAVMLEDRTELRVDRLSLEKTALTLRRGSLLASVRPRPGRPRFFVQAPGARIEVTGTVFWVEVKPAHLVVAVLRGTVRVTRKGLPARTVSAGQRLVLPRRAQGPVGSNERASRVIDAESRTEAWRWVRALELVAGGRHAGMQIRSQPAGALVLVDDLLLGETPLEARLRPGYHRLELRKPGYAPQVEWISVIPGKTLRRTVSLGGALLADPRRAGALVRTGPAAAPDGTDGAAKGKGRLTNTRPPWSRDATDEGEGARAEPPKPSAVGTVKPSPAVPTAAELVARARRLRAKADFRGAATAFRELLRRYPGHRWARTARVSLGMLLLDELANPSGALKQFNGYLARHKVGALAQEAAYGRIRALRRLGRRAAEVRRLREFLRLYPQAVQGNAVRLRLRALGQTVPSRPSGGMGLGSMGSVK